MRLGRAQSRYAPVVLLVGDIAALLLWVLLGLQMHRMTDGLLPHLARVAAPFIVGWLAAAGLTGAYLPSVIRRPRTFMVLSVAAWLLAVAVGLIIRGTVFGEGFVPVFALVTLIFTGLFLLGWRSLFIWRLSR